MIKYSSTATIKAPPRRVFDLLVDQHRYGEWTEMVDVSFDGAPRVGTRGTFRLARGPIKGTLSVAIVEFEQDRLVVFKIDHPTLEWRNVARLEPVGEGTRLEYSGEIRLRGWRRLLEPLMAAEVRAGEGKEVERLKELLEAEAPATVAASA